MHFTSLASGSSGNAILVGEAGRHFLIDCGISGVRLLHNLSQLNIAASEIEGIVVTHEHSDHIRGVGILARKLKIPVYTTEGLWEEITPLLGDLAESQRKEVEKEFSCAGLDVVLYPTSHDSRESYGLKITRPSEQGRRDLVVGVATDSGVITEEMHRHLQGCDAYVLEANHDEQMLKHGPYPAHLKKRILSQYGHLENEKAAEGLLTWLTGKTQRVLLAHLSEENNTPGVAFGTVKRMLRDSRRSKEFKNLMLHVAPRHVPHSLLVLKE